MPHREPPDPSETYDPRQDGQESPEGPARNETAGKAIGRYHLLHKIGEGGMGEVWLAEQREPVRRRVALKLIKAGMNTREVMARFASERQTLALMDHPAIAKVFDAGTAADGAPYFVMEYVAGVPITAYCDNHRLSTRERLELFRRVCDGVQHAHQKAIIHRDLKPSNILVTEVDGRPAPRIIDFGLAKALSQGATADTLFTRVGALVGTPEYMSPEQASSSGEDVDTRTDVYSLGIILYELLAGAPPLDFRRIAFDEFIRRLCEEEPPRPSTRIRSQDPATSLDVARKRQTEPTTLAKQVRGDLDSIALKALEKAPARRYGSPSDLAADVGRYLNHEPVLAVLPSVGYRARKFARRYRGALATACAFALVLVVAAAISIRQSVRANREAAEAQAVNNFLTNDLLAQASPSVQAGLHARPDPDLKVKTALDRAAARIAGKFDRQPDVEAAIRDTIGQAYMDLGLYADARTQLERALELHRKVQGPDDPKTLRTLSHLGHSVYYQGKYPAAEKLLTQALTTGQRVMGAASPDVLSTLNDLAADYWAQGKYAQAEALYTPTLEVQRRVLGPDDPGTLVAMINLGNVYFSERKYARAESLYDQSLQVSRRTRGPEHPSTLLAMNDLAGAYYSEGKYDQAEALYVQVVDVSRRVLGPEHPATLTPAMNLASVYFKQSKFQQADAIYSQTLEIQRRVLGAEHPNTLNTLINLAIAEVAEGKYAQAAVHYSQGAEISRRVLGPKHSFTLAFMNDMPDAYYLDGKYSRAEALFEQALAADRAQLGAEDPSTLDALADMGFMYQREGKYAQAEECAAQALAGRRHALGAEDRATMDAQADLALAYVSQGKFGESEPLARGAEAVDTRNIPDEWQRFRAESLLGASLAGERRFAEAEPLLVEGYQGMVARKGKMEAPDMYYMDRGHAWLVQLYRAWGKPEKAAEWSKR